MYSFSLFDEGTEIPYQVIREKRYGDGSIKSSEIVFYCDLPSLGYKTIILRYIAPSVTPKGMDVDVSSRRISTKYYDITFGENGGLSMLFDKALRLDVVKRDGLNARFRAEIDGKKETSSGEVAFEVVGPLVTIVRERGNIGNIPYENRITIYNELRRLDFETTFTFNRQRIGRKIGVEEGTWMDRISNAWFDDHKLGVIFQANTENTTVYSDRPFLVHEVVPYKGTFRDQFPLEEIASYGLTWMDVSSPHFGLALFNRGTMGYRVHKGDIFMVLALSGPVEEAWKDVRLKGNYTYRYALYPHPGSWKEGDVVREADNYNLRALTYVGDPHRGNAPRQLSLLEPSVEGVIVSALYTRNGELYVRMYEYLGENTSLNLASPDFFLTAERVNLMHEEAEPIAFPFPVRNNEIITLKVSAEQKDNE
ncbi:MAG: alpha-mannosidase [Candidatus Bathyarchaeota archaeon B63]|nr:MAG: alpha-mannosidase [Candidatus Bathyarchaeota archaeon B63]